jgi:hypothetical protein
MVQVAHTAANYDEDGPDIISRAVLAAWMAEEPEQIAVVTTEAAIELAFMFVKEHGLVPQVVLVQDPEQQSTKYLDAFRVATAHGIFSRLHVVHRATAEPSSTDMHMHAWMLVETDSKQRPSWMTDVRFAQAV